MLVVNLFGAPGSGKSTGAAYIFSQLKIAGATLSWSQNLSRTRFGRTMKRCSRIRRISLASRVSK